MLYTRTVMCIISLVIITWPAVHTARWRLIKNTFNSPLLTLTWMVYRHFASETLRTQDTSAPSRWVGNGRTVRHQCRRVVPNCLQLGHFLTCDLSKNEQSYALYRCDRPTQRRAVITGWPSVTLSHSRHFKPCLERWNSSLLNVESSSFGPNRAVRQLL